MHCLFENKMDFGEESQFSSWHSSLCSMPVIKICTDRSLCLSLGLCLGEGRACGFSTYFVQHCRVWRGCSLCPFRTQTFRKSQPLSGSSDYCAAAGEVATAQDHQGVLCVGEKSQGAWMAAAASFDIISFLPAQKILTRYWSLTETSGIVEGHCLNCCSKVVCDVLAVLTTFTLICE